MHSDVARSDAGLRFRVARFRVRRRFPRVKASDAGLGRCDCPRDFPAEDLHSQALADRCSDEACSHDRRLNDPRSDGPRFLYPCFRDWYSVPNFPDAELHGSSAGLLDAVFAIRHAQGQRRAHGSLRGVPSPQSQDGRDLPMRGTHGFPARHVRDQSACA